MSEAKSWEWVTLAIFFSISEAWSTAPSKSFKCAVNPTCKINKSTIYPKIKDQRFCPRKEMISLTSCMGRFLLVSQSCCEIWWLWLYYHYYIYHYYYRHCHYYYHYCDWFIIITIIITIFIIVLAIIIIIIIIIVNNKLSWQYYLQTPFVRPHPFLQATLSKKRQ